VKAPATLHAATRVVASRQRSFLEYVFQYMLPTLSGNVPGGVSLVAALARAQFVASEQLGKVWSECSFVRT
jgi:hypothetical protein